MTNPNDPAFIERNELVAHQTQIDGSPCNCSYGLTKREYFAAMAMQGFRSNSKDLPSPESMSVKTFEEVVALCSVEQADALIAELNKTDLK